MLLYCSACKKATAMVFIWGDREYSAVNLEYNTVSERYLGCWDISKTVLGVLEKIQNFNFVKKHPKLFCFAYNSATKYHSDAVLYSKQTVGYSLSPHIKTIAVAFLQA